MSRRIFYRRILIMILIASCFSFTYYIRDYLGKKLPSIIRVEATADGNIELDYPFTIKGGVLDVNNRIGSKNQSYEAKIYAFGIFQVKDVEVKVTESVYLYPSGMPIGLYLKTNGVMVIGSGEIIGDDSMKYEPAFSIVKPGDYIISLNGITVSSKLQLQYLVNEYGENSVILGIARDNTFIKVRMTPVKTEDNTYKLGIWVRDDTQGIGTLTFITEDGEFGALGHGISDVDTGLLLASNGGILYKAKIWGIDKGQVGKPGGLCGSINYEDSNILGKITLNSSQGIYGKMEISDYSELCNMEKMKVRYKQDVKEGKAYIRSYVSGEYVDYEIEITGLNLSDKTVNKGIMLRVVDERLLDITEGIVQGMSGTPIIQDGCVIGAVTHVFVKDPTRGYGIFIEQMLDN